MCIYKYIHAYYICYYHIIIRLFINYYMLVLIIHYTIIFISHTRFYIDLRLYIVRNTITGLMLSNNYYRQWSLKLFIFYKMLVTAYLQILRKWLLYYKRPCFNIHQHFLQMHKQIVINIICDDV